jgi:hypoxanthine phosphoribosyltransferase
VSLSGVKPPQLKVLIEEVQLRQRIRELGQQISQDYAGRHVHLICVLKGACVFLADLIRHLPVDLSIDFMALSSYSNSLHTSGEVRILKDLDSIIQGRDVLLVEDILDTGLTLSYLLRTLQARCPRSLQVVTLLSKSARRIKLVDVAYVGFEIPNEFVVGYGLDYEENYRNLPNICALKIDD